ncbi:hypothetical protein DSL64_08090 [Dyadobacter luteus]|uniref:Uncharacterized protein n=1 Tax=Dyadobacter luteus TaxID=2259619 RepID=A0A3D8YEC4_9BACT|nr:hypothetical protein DSL64_08090 [Dyadobacter luteus]
MSVISYKTGTGQLVETANLSGMLTTQMAGLTDKCCNDNAGYSNKSNLQLPKNQTLQTKMIILLISIRL